MAWFKAEAPVEDALGPAGRLVHLGAFRCRIVERVEHLRGHYLVRAGDSRRRTDLGHGPTDASRWPVLTLWWPGGVLPGAGVLRLVELALDGEHPGVGHGDGAALFPTLADAGIPVHLWRPGDLADVVEPTLRAWAVGRPVVL